MTRLTRDKIGDILGIDSDRAVQGVKKESLSLKRACVLQSGKDRYFRKLVDDRAYLLMHETRVRLLKP